MPKQPSFQYYPKDWRADPVWGCSLAARGLWHEMMDRMHECKPYGYLCENGRPIADERIARLVGCSTQEYAALLAELDAAGVPRRNASGIIYSKRMVEDEKKRKEWRKRQNKHRLANRDITHSVTAKSCGSPSSSLSSNQNHKEKPRRLAAPSSPPTCGNVENPKPLGNYSAVKKLIGGARYLMADESLLGPDLKEELKCWAARNGIPYEAQSIGTALDIAKKRSEVYEATRIYHKRLREGGKAGT